MSRKEKIVLLFFLRVRSKLVSKRISLREKRAEGRETFLKLGNIRLAFVVENWRFQANIALILLLLEMREEGRKIDDALAWMEVAAAAIKRKAVATKIFDMNMAYALIQPEPGSVKDLSNLIVESEELSVESNVAAGIV